MPQQNGVLVVTGGSRGIGAATCLMGAERGYAVVVNYTSNVEAAEQVCARIHQQGGKAVAVRGDVANPDDVEHVFHAADRLGPLAALVNNAGMIFPNARLGEIDAARLARTFAVNVTGAFLCSAQAVRRMSTRQGGTGGGIVNVSSGAAKLGGGGVYLDYAASKGAIDTFTVGLALEVVGEGIRVNSVRPGVIETEIHASTGDSDRVARMIPNIPMARAGSSEEVARAIHWLLSDESAYSTGTTLTVSGGRAILP
jgi:NAD(P)-dependent dehydrogenase (short-subunit alcohol dehydrogenase family)